MANENKYYRYPFADTGTKTPIPDEGVSGAVGYNTGYGPDYELPQGDASRKRIGRANYNSMFNGITKNLKQNQERNHPTWISDDGTGVAFEYSKGVIVDHSGSFWVSLEDANSDEPSGGSTKWALWNAANVGNGANLISNHNFTIETPDDSQPKPDATPRNYTANYQVFSGWFADATVGVTALTYQNGVVNFTAGTIYTDVPKSGALQFITAFKASIAGVDESPVTDNVSFVDNGTSIRVSVAAAAVDVFSVKLQEGGVADRHETTGNPNEIANAGDSQLAGGKVWPVDNVSAKVGDSGLIDVSILKDSSAGINYRLSEKVSGEITALSFANRTATVGGIDVILVEWLSYVTTTTYRESDSRSAVENMIAGIPIPASSGDVMSTGGVTWSANKTSGLPIAGGLFANVTSSNDNSSSASKKFNEDFGGYIIGQSSSVESGKIYLNLILTDENYGSYLYFDAPEMPVTPVAYSSSYGGTVKNGIFGRTDRDAVNKRTLYGYRAGFDSTSTFATYYGQQCGELTSDVKESTDTGGSCGFGLIALYNSQSRSTCAMGMEAANQSNTDNSVISGTFAGAACTGNKLFLGGYQSGYRSTLTESVGVGYGTLINSVSLKSAAVGAFSQNSSEGDENNSHGHRALSECDGDNNFAGGNFSGFVTGGSTASNRTLVGHLSGKESNADGITGVGRSALENNIGSFVSSLGYLAGKDNQYARVTLLGQGTSATGVDQVQLGAAGTTPYAYAALQIRSDARDKMDFNPVSAALKSFLLDVEFQTYRVNYRESYRDLVEVQDGTEILTEKTPIKDKDGLVVEWSVTERETPKFKIVEEWAENDGSRAGKRHHAGVSAQQVKEAMDKNGVDFSGYQDHSINGGEDRLSIAYEQFIPIIGAIVQDHNKKVTDLESKIDSLEDRLAKAGI